MAIPTSLQIPPNHPALAMNILSRLNTETLLTCRLICKSWLRIISDPKFCLFHHSRTPIGILVHTNPPKSISRTVESPNSHFHTVGYSPRFVSLNNVSKGEEVKRVKGSKIPDKLFALGSYDCAGSGLMPALKTTKLNSGYGSPAFKEGLPKAIIKFLDLAKGCVNNASTPFPQRSEKSSITSLKLFIMPQS
ncbi:hypothetical protein M0R45_020739 [Rubus argutus]|uniref:F-box domain-containing protein n=1 Tax=Rubus argutus TaxID=59490 RepID=A0AAW1X9P2_RUBAR